MKLKIILIINMFFLIIFSEATNTKTDEIIKFMKTACASSEKVEIKVEGDGTLSLKQGIKGKVSFSKSNKEGIVEGFSSEFQKQNLQSIRDCMKPYIPMILDNIFNNNSVNGNNKIQLNLQNKKDILHKVEIGMTFNEIIDLVGNPDEVENSYFMFSDTDAIRYGGYWLISRSGKVLDCIIKRKAFERLCSKLGDGCESQTCSWYEKNFPSSIVKY